MRRQKIVRIASMSSALRKRGTTVHRTLKAPAVRSMAGRLAVWQSVINGRKGQRMKKYRKKPVVIEAVQWWRDGHGNNNFTEVEALNKGSCRELLVNENGELLIFTLEGQHLASSGDYIIRGVKGELYPCKPDIFEATYEEVSE